MAGFLLDTNVLSEFKRRGDPNPNVVAQSHRSRSPLGQCLSFGEIRKGIERLPPGKRRSELERWLDHDLDQWFEQRLLPVTRAISERWGVLDARGLDRGTPIPSIDGLIAATALECDLTVVTRNVKDFANLGLKTYNPWEPGG